MENTNYLLSQYCSSMVMKSRMVTRILPLLPPLLNKKYSEPNISQDTAIYSCSPIDNIFFDKIITIRSITWKVCIPPAPAPLLVGALTDHIRLHYHHQQQLHQLVWKGYKTVSMPFKPWPSGWCEHWLSYDNLTESPHQQSQANCQALTDIKKCMVVHLITSTVDSKFTWL